MRSGGAGVPQRRVAALGAGVHRVAKGSERAGPREPMNGGRGRRSPSKGSAGAEAREELVRAVGDTQGERANERLRDAARAFERERYEEARSLLVPVANRAPGAASVRELLGLSFYRLGRWKEAVRELEAFRALVRSTEQHPCSPMPTAPWATTAR